MCLQLHVVLCAAAAATAARKERAHHTTHTHTQHTRALLPLRLKNSQDILFSCKAAAGL